MKVILLTTLLLFSVNGFSQNWRKVPENEKGNSYYIDFDNIKKHNSLVYYWVLSDYIEPTEYGDYSVIVENKVDCVEEKLFRLSSTFYSQPMGKGRITDEFTPNKLLYPKPKSVLYVLVNLHVTMQDKRFGDY